jgi:hypothetical protein
VSSTGDGVHACIIAAWRYARHRAHGSRVSLPQPER